MGSQRSGASVTESQKERARAAFTKSASSAGTAGGQQAKKKASAAKQPAKTETTK